MAEETLQSDGSVYAVLGPPSGAVSYRRGIAFDSVGHMYYTTNSDPSDVYIAGLRVSMLGELVITAGIPPARPYTFNGGLPSDKRDGSVIAQLNNTPGLNDPYVVGIRVGPLGGVYLNSSAVPEPPRNTIAPVVTGSTGFGDTLTCTQGTWTGTDPITYTYQWYSTSGGEIPGATGNTYVLPFLSTETLIFCDVTGTNTEGAELASSNVITVSSMVFTPAALFANGEAGACWDFSDNSKMRTGVGAVPTLGQSVESVESSYGALVALLQNDTSFRPILGRQPETGTRNLLVFSQVFQNTSWLLVNATVTDNFEIGPTGALDGAKLLATDTGTNLGSIDQVRTTTINTVYTFSVYLKQGNTSLSTLNVYRASPFAQALLTITWGTTPTAVPSGEAFGGGIEPANNGWYRAYLTMDSSAATQMVSRVYTIDQGTTPSGSEVYLAHAQFEIGPTPTAYQTTQQIYNIIEAGVPDIYGLWFDGDNDRLGNSAGPSNFPPRGTTSWVSFRETVHTPSAGIACVAPTSGADWNLQSGYSLQIDAGSDPKCFTVVPNARTHYSQAFQPQFAQLLGHTLTDTGAYSLTINGLNPVTASLGVQGSVATRGYFVGCRTENNAQIGPTFQGFISVVCFRGAMSTTDELNAMNAWVSERSPGIDVYS